MGYRSFLNLLNPMIIGKSNFKLSESIKFNIGLGYSLAPFGDFVDENVWLKITDKYNISIYFRQYQNRKYWFNAFGVSLIDYNLFSRFFVSTQIDYWQQPIDFSFNAKDSFTGGAITMDIRYYLFDRKEFFLKGISLNIGAIYKSKGYLPEELYLEEHFGLRFGTSIKL